MDDVSAFIRDLSQTHRPIFSTSGAFSTSCSSFQSLYGCGIKTITLQRFSGMITDQRSPIGLLANERETVNPVPVRDAPA